MYRLEDEVRVLGADLAAARNRAAQLEHVVRAKERDVARARDEKEAAKAAERERARVSLRLSCLHAALLLLLLHCGCCAAPRFSQRWAVGFECER